MPLEAPEPDGNDNAHALARGAIGSLPVLGSLAQELYGLCFAAPFQSKTQAFVRDLADAVNRHDIQIATLANDDRFHTAAMQAAITAGRTRDAAKRVALRNAVLNVAKRSVEEALEDVFLSLVDVLSPTHLRVLEYLDAPGTSHHGRPGPGRVVIESVRSGMDLSPEVASAVVTDLRARDLVLAEPQGVRYAHDPTARQTTEFGRALLAFLREPSV